MRPAQESAPRELPAEGLADRTAELAVIRQRVVEGLDAESALRQHRLGKSTARERIARLLDEGSFNELEMLRRHRATDFGMDAKRPYTDGVVTGWGTVEGRRVFVYAHDFGIFGGSLGEAHAAKIHKVMDLAESAGAPLIGLNDGAGARIQEGVMALAGYGGIFRRNVQASGVIPQISVMLGPCAGGAAYSPALTDFVLMVRGTASMYVTGPDVIKAVTGEEIDFEGLGGAEVHARSGQATSVHDDEDDAFEQLRWLLSFLPQNNREFPPEEPCDDPVDRSCDGLLDIVPSSPNQPYDVRRVIEEIVDHGEFLELQEAWAGNVVIGLARIGGQVVGLVANQPLVLAGVLDIDASQKAARFIRFCDSFNIPLVSLVDVPGFLPGVDQEHNAIIRNGAKLLYAYCEATVPRIQVLMRKAYGGAYIVMDSRSIGTDLSLAWPSNEVAVMGAEAATNVIHRRTILAAEDQQETRRQLVEEYQRTLMHPYYGAERGLVDDVIDPRETRSAIHEGLRMLRSKRVDLPKRKHGNSPL
ncbi:acyl-CoA carboxylase subunit beta [Streptomyces sp. enrichment culture]|uniref:acyl-CoA carboxylase subunit beta n=1 Tax=Streptomyces sp. enrichment culture TaxID=1795815 RepID=UPI003F55202A